MITIKSFYINGKKLYRVAEPTKKGIKISWCTLEEVLRILSTREEEYD